MNLGEFLHLFEPQLPRLQSEEDDKAYIIESHDEGFNGTMCGKGSARGLVHGTQHQNAGGWGSGAQLLTSPQGMLMCTQG